MAKKPQHLPFRSASDDDPIRELGAEFNLGPKSSVWLHDAGVRTRNDVAQLGTIEVCRRIMAAGHPISVVVAYALEGGLVGCGWNELPPVRKLQIKEAFKEAKARWSAVAVREFDMITQFSNKLPDSLIPNGLK